MGRWAQRTRGGGGASTSSIIQMVSAHIVDGATITVTYNANITAITFTAADFTTTPSNFSSDLVISQVGTVLTLDFGNDISFETAITYTGSATGIQTPDSVNLT